MQEHTSETPKPSLQKQPHVQKKKSVDWTLVRYQAEKHLGIQTLSCRFRQAAAQNFVWKTE